MLNYLNNSLQNQSPLIQKMEISGVHNKFNYKIIYSLLINILWPLKLLLSIFKITNPNNINH